MTSRLLAGAAEVDITPPVGTAMAGALNPRASEGVQDPLTIKAVVLSCGGVEIAYVLLDIIALLRDEADPAVNEASRRSGIPARNTVWAASHTHTGPYTSPKSLFAMPDACGVVNMDWLASLPAKFADAVSAAKQRLRSARISRERAYCQKGGHNRRLRFKDGREINAWCLHRGEEESQCLGWATVIDPEIGILCFDDDAGSPIAVLWQYVVHTNSNFGRHLSADYPGVVAARIRERFGPAVVPIFVPGACADVNPNFRYRELGDIVAGLIIERLDKRKPRDGGVLLGARKLEMAVPYRDLSVDPDERIRASQWHPDQAGTFRREWEIMRAEGKTESQTVLQAWRIGEVGFASLPGELFVDWGLRIKEQSPFPWTYPVELGGDYLGYLVTEQAWRSGGYESLTARSAKPSVEGVAKMVEGALGLLMELWEEGEGKACLA